MKLKHDLSLGKNFPRFKYCDATLTTDGSRSLPVHRAILASVSPKLEALFDSNYRSKVPLVVEHVDFDTLQRVIESIYFGEITLDDNRADDLVTEAMEKLQIGLIIVPERTVVVAVQTDIEEIKDENDKNTIGDAVESETREINDAIDNKITTGMAAESGFKVIDSTKKTIGDAVESRTRKLKEDIDNNNSVAIEGNVHSHSKDPSSPIANILDSSLELKHSNSDQVTSCLDLNLIVSPSRQTSVSNKVHLRVRKDLFKIAPSNLQIKDSSPPGKEIQQEIVNLGQTEDIVILGSKKLLLGSQRQKKRKREQIQSKTTVKKRKNEDPVEEDSLSQSVFGKKKTQGQENEVNCLITSSEKQQTADQAPDQQTCSVRGPRPDTNANLAGNKTKLNMSFNKFLIAQEVRREIDHLKKTEIIVLSGTKKQNRMKLGKIQGAIENLFSFQYYCQEKNKIIPEGTQFTSVRRETLSLSSQSVTPQARLTFTFGGTGKEQGKNCSIRAIAVDEDQLAYVVSFGNRGIQVFNQDYSLLFQFGTEHLSVPNDIAITCTSSGTDMILVSDKGDKDIKLFTCLSGHFIRTLGLHLTGSPTAVSANRHGTVVVSEVRDSFGRRDIIVCDLFGNVSSTFRMSTSPCSLYSGLLVTNKGKIFIPNMRLGYNEELLVYNNERNSFKRGECGFLIQGQVVGMAEVGEELLVASLKFTRLRLTLYTYRKRKWTILFMLDSDQRLPFFPCSFTLLSFSPVLRVVVGDKQDNLHVLTVPNSPNQLI